MPLLAHHHAPDTANVEPVESIHSGKEFYEQKNNNLQNHWTGSIPLEVTIPERVSTLEIPNLTSLKIDRLNLYNLSQYD